jgi:pimeloyl-ACP methyl ester carboxylesterase
MRHRARAGWIGLVVVFFALLAGAARADLIFLKDGYVLQGKVKREVTAELDPVTKEMTLIPKGFFMLDDGPRRIIFSPSQIRIVEKLEAPSEERVVARKGFLIFQPQRPPNIDAILEVGPWDLKDWTRDFYFSSPGRPRIYVKQSMQTLSPYFASVAATSKFHWWSAYLTREFDPELVHKLLLSHPDLQDPVEPKNAPKDDPKRDTKPRAKSNPKSKEKEKPKVAPQPKRSDLVARRLRLCDFFAQAGWFDIADRELDRLLKDRPAEKERVARARSMVEQLRIRDQWEQTKTWYQAGQYERVRKRLAEFPTKDVPERIAVDVREMKERLAGSAALMAEADKALKECHDRAMDKDTGTPRSRTLASAVRVIREEMHPSTVGRLDAFLGQVRDSARQQSRGKSSTQTPEKLLSLAITGWVLGSPSAEAVPEVAINLWKTRQLVIEYLQEKGRAQRGKLLADYQRAGRPSVHLDEIAQLIDNLPPVIPAKVQAGQTVERKIGEGRNAVTYHLRLPPEYSHTRQYPVLIVLANGGETAKTMLERWSAPAADHGYILAAPVWARGLADSYAYTPEEHRTVLETLRDLRRCFQVDSDRVFLFGLGEGGKMAFDVGLAHPHLFAGVLPMCAGPNYFPYRYWRNAQYLPFYCASGTRAADSNTLLTEQFKNWAIRGYPTLWIEYKGRGVDWLSGEVPNMLDWMRHQRRAFPMRQLGTDGGGGAFGNEFCTMRPEDDRFYWLSTSDISPRNIVHPNNWRSLTPPATLTGRIDTQSNEIYLRTSGLNQISIWLGRNPKGQYMIDFDKPVTVHAGFAVPLNKARIQPNLAVLLEDLYERGDRKHLFVARVDVDLRRNQAVVAGVAKSR